MRDTVAKGNPILIGREVTTGFYEEKRKDGFISQDFFFCSYNVRKKKQKQKLPLLLLIHSANSQKVS